MGAWGTGLYQNDVACGVKSEYVGLLSIGESNISATQKIIDSYYYELQDCEDAPIFWFALADTQWRYGRLLDEVKEQALTYIENETDLISWQDNKSLYNKRKQTLEKLKQKLLSPQPVERKVPKLNCHKSFWNPGDILLYQLTSEKIQDSKWHNKYILFEIVGKTHEWFAGLPRDQYYNEYDVAKIYNWIGKGPIDKEKLKDLSYFQQLVQPLQRKAYMSDLMLIMDFSNRELKKLNVEVIFNNGHYDMQKDYIMDICGKEFLTFANSDVSLVGDLLWAEKRGVLIDETIN